MSKNFKNFEVIFIPLALRFTCRFHYYYESKTIKVFFGLKDHKLRRTDAFKASFEREYDDIKLEYDEYDEELIWEDEREKIIPVVNWFSYTSKYRLDDTIYGRASNNREMIQYKLYNNLIEEMKTNINRVLIKPDLNFYLLTPLKNFTIQKPLKTRLNEFYDIEEDISWIYSDFFREEDKGKINLQELLEHGLVYFPEKVIHELMEDNEADMEWVGEDAVREMATYLKDLALAIIQWAIESCRSENRNEILPGDIEKAIDFVTALYNVKREAPKDEIIWSEIHDEFDKIVPKLKELLDKVRERGVNSSNVIELFQMFSSYSKLDGEYVDLDDRDTQIQVMMDYGDKFWIKVQDGLFKFGKGDIVKVRNKKLYELTYNTDSIQKILTMSDDAPRDALSHVIDYVLEALTSRLEVMERESQEIHRNTALIIGENVYFSRIKVLKNMVKLRNFKILKCDNFLKAKEILNEKHDRIALILIDKKSFPETANLFFDELKRDPKLGSISITIFDS